MPYHHAYFIRFQAYLLSRLFIINLKHHSFEVLDRVKGSNPHLTRWSLYRGRATIEETKAAALVKNANLVRVEWPKIALLALIITPDLRKHIDQMICHAVLT